MSHPDYPLFLDVRGRRVVVVGGGPVAARRASNLVEAGADVVAIAPQVCPDLADLADAGKVTWWARPYASEDLAEAWLVHTATGDLDTDTAVAVAAEQARIWCVRADDGAASAAWTPAVAHAGDVSVAVSAGADPARAGAIRNAISALLDSGGLPTRTQRRGRNRTGRVALVGGGPGDPELITVRGRRLLSDADVVVVDRLAPRDLLASLDSDIEVVEAGKGPQAHRMTQTQINALLVERAQAGLNVVRLKGGDPFVLGRGGEEVLACAKAGIACEVVPGVTSAVAVPEAAGIPVTHRDVARDFTVVSAHLAHPGDEPDWAAFAQVPGTIVILMGVGGLADVMSALHTHGRPGSTPVAVIERGTTPEQRTTVGTVATIADIAHERQVRSPAVIVVGDVVSVLD